VTDTASDAAASSRRTPRWLLAVILGIFGLLYAYAVWNAIGNLIASVQAASSAGVSLSALGWFLWIFAAVFPVIVFAAAYRIASRRVAWQVLLIMLGGLALVAVFWLNVVAYTALYTTSLLA
jgi:hypothetical protein